MEKGSGLFEAGLRFRSVTGSFEPAPSLSLAHPQKSLLQTGYDFSENALDLKLAHSLSKTNKYTSMASAHDSPPKYFQISREIIQLIQRGKLPPGSPVPSENEII